MSDGGSRARQLRRIICTGAWLQVALYIYLIVTIAQRSNPKGDGMEWVALGPATLLLALGGLPALIWRNVDRGLRTGVALAVIGLALSAALFLEIVREMNGY